MEGREIEGKVGGWPPEPPEEGNAITVKARRRRSLALGKRERGCEGN